MKKIILVLGLAFSISFSANASKYKLTDVQLEQNFKVSQEVSFEEMYSADLTALNLTGSKMSASSSQTRTGFLLRSFFCGSIGLHRYYMGTEKNYMWALYFCGTIVGDIDFFWVLFDKDALSKFSNNDKFLVFLD
jgi:hypothetical protein